MFRIVFAVTVAALVFALPAVLQAQTDMIPGPSPAAVPDDLGASVAPSDYHASSSCCSSCCGRFGGRFGVGCGCHVQMYPHYPYFPPMHGYYYFRPYHHSHLIKHQAIVGGWGGDTRAPYANEVFQRVYAEYEAETRPLR